MLEKLAPPFPIREQRLHRSWETGGELRQRYQEGQEDQLGAQHDRALGHDIHGGGGCLDQLRKEGYPVREEDVAHLLSLIHEHINMPGRFFFNVPEGVERGELRPFRTPGDDFEE